MLDHRSESVENSGPLGSPNGFHGRVEELVGVGALLGTARLVTLTGPPGVGKTRLATEVADRGSERAVFVDLASVHEPALVPRALARALAVADVAGQSVLDSVVAYLRRRKQLLLLDNCEHVLRASQGLAVALLEGCPNVVILATSREALGVEGERLWPLSPLPVPLPDETFSLAALMAYPAVSLFVERARAVQPGFALNAYTARAVAEICRGLDGVPLAIELAAARVGALTPAEIARGLDDRLGLLSRGGPGLPARQQRLDAAVDWSHELLSDRERALCRRLSVFVSGFELDAVETVCAGAGIEAGEVAELFAALESKSLSSVSPIRAYPVRYRLLETIRAYAQERLDDAGEVAALRRKHAGFYVGLAEAAEPELTGPRQKQWLEHLDDERENLRAALEWSLTHGQGEWALRLAGSLVLFWRVRCHFSEGRELLGAALSTGEQESGSLRARALWGSGFLALMEGDYDAAVPALERSVAMFRELGEPRGLARALMILVNRTDCDDVAPLLDESVALAREVGDTWCVAHALSSAGLQRSLKLDLRAARGLFEMSLEVARAFGDAQSIRLALLGLGRVAVWQGDLGYAESLLTEAVVASERLGEDYAIATALARMAEVTWERGDYNRARELCEQSQALLPHPCEGSAFSDGLIFLARVCLAQGDVASARFHLERAASDGQRPTLLVATAELALDGGGDADRARSILEQAIDLARNGGAKMVLAVALLRLGRLVRAEGKQRRAAAFIDEALTIMCGIGRKPVIVNLIEASAGLASDGGRRARAALLLGAADALRAREGYVRAPWDADAYDRDLQLIRAGLTPEEFAKAYAEGAELSIEETVTLARSGGRRRRRPANGWASLTEREREVAQLAAEGRTNPEIAERLLISPETVKNHLKHAFPKLGVSSREEI